VSPQHRVVDRVGRKLVVGESPESVSKRRRSSRDQTFDTRGCGRVFNRLLLRPLECGGIPVKRFSTLIFHEPVGRGVIASVVIRIFLVRLTRKALRVGEHSTPTTPISTTYGRTPTNARNCVGPMPSLGLLDRPASEVVGRVPVVGSAASTKSSIVVIVVGTRE